MKYSVHLVLIIIGVVGGDPVHPLGKIKTAVDERLEKMKEIMIQEVRTADIRLLRKDKNRNSNSHPVLSATHVDVKRARDMFVTNWHNLYTWSNDLDSDYKPVHEAYRLFYSNHYNSSLDTLMIMHDSCGSARDSNVIKIIEALKLRNFDANYNIMMLDFKKLMCEDTFSTLRLQRNFYKIGFDPQLEFLAIEIGNAIYKGISKGKVRAGQINIVGLGISTKLAGLVAKQIRKLSGKINSILGLDPPISLHRTHLYQRNARHIHIYHTFKLIPGTGLLTARAKTDFVFGGAKRDPNCKNSINTRCFQEFGVQLFVSTLLFPELFPGRWCPDYEKFSDHFCDTNEYSFVSFPPSNSTDGAYQMDIDYQFPFGKGLEGIYEQEEQSAKDELADIGSGEMGKLSAQEYYIRLEKEVSRIRFDMMTCIHGVMTPAAFMRCVMTTVPTVKKLVKQRMINKLGCEAFDKSPTGQICKYETRFHNEFELPF